MNVKKKPVATSSLKRSTASSELLEQVDELDEREEFDLSTLLDLQEAKQVSQTKQANYLIMRFAAGVMITLLLALAFSSAVRDFVSGVAQNLQESFDDSDDADVAKLATDQYHEVLAKLGSRSNDIDHASESLGVDPSTVVEDGMDAEMKAMMGGEGRTPGERQRIIEGVASLAGVDLAKPSDFDKQSEPNHDLPVHEDAETEDP